jgi:hypothetical protein
MIFLTLAFLGGILTLFFSYSKNKNPSSSSLPLFGSKLTPVPSEPTPTLAPQDPLTQKGQEIINDLDKINQDLELVKKSDARLVPPLFYLEEEVLE